MHPRKTNLGVQIVPQSFLQSALDGMLSGHERHVVRQFVVRGDNGSFSVRVVLRPAGSAKYLENVEYSEIYECSLLSIVDLRTLN